MLSNSLDGVLLQKLPFAQLVVITMFRRPCQLSLYSPHRTSISLRCILIGEPGGFLGIVTKIQTGLPGSLGSNHGRGIDVYLHTGCEAAHSLIQCTPRAISSVTMRSELEAGQSISLSAEVNLWTCTSALPLCVHDVRLNSFTFSRRLPETAVFYRVFPGKLTSLCRVVPCSDDL